MDSSRIQKTGMLSFALEALGFLGIYTYFTGWWFIASYLYEFGLSQSAIEFSSHFVISQAFRVYTDPYMLIIVTISIAYFSLRIFVLSKDYKGKTKKIWPIHVSDAILALTLFLLLYIIAMKIGKEDAFNIKHVGNNKLPNIEISFVEGKKPEIKECKYKLLFSKNNSYYIFCQMESFDLDSYRLSVINKSIVDYAEVYRENPD